MSVLYADCPPNATVVGLGAGATMAFAQQPAPGDTMHPLNVPFNDVKWQKIVPELGDRSPEIAIPHVDPKTQATQLLIRVPKNSHVPKHWHSANETHTVVSGTFVIECEGQRSELSQGSFNYIPGKCRMRHGRSQTKALYSS